MSIRRTNAAKATRSRSGALDVVKVIGLGVIILFHLRSGFGDWSAVFFILSGYLSTARRPLVDEARGRFRTLIVPYVSWLLLVGALVLTRAAIQGEAPTVWWRRASEILWGGAAQSTPLTAFWFLTALFVATLTHRILRRLPFPVFLAALVAILAMTVVPVPIAVLPETLGTGIVCSLFVAAGAGYRLLEAEIPHRGFAAGAGLVVGLGMFLVGASGDISLKNGEFGTPLVGVGVLVLVSCSAITLARVVFDGRAERIAEIARRLVGYSIPIICLQTVPLWWHPSFVSGPVLMALCFAVPVVVGVVLERFPPRSPVRSLLMPG